MNTDQHPTRTLANAVMEVRIGVHYGVRNERFWRRVDTTINLTGAFAGTAAFAAVLAGNGLLGAVAGVALAASSCVALVTRPLETAFEFRDYRRKFGELDAIAWDLSLAELDKRLKCLQQEAPIGIKGLQGAAWNDAVLANGHAGRVVPLNLYERVLSAIA